MLAPPQAQAAQLGVQAATEILKTEEGQKLIGTTGRIAEKAATEYVDVAGTTARGVASTVLEQEKRREVGSDIGAAVKGIGGLLKGAVTNVRDAGIAVGQDLGLYTSRDAKLNNAMTRARREFLSAYDNESSESKKVRSAEKAYLEAIQYSGATINPDDQTKVDALLNKLKEEAVTRVAPATAAVGGCDTCGKHSAPIEGGCDTCGKGSVAPAAILGGFLANAVTGGRYSGGASSIDLAMMLLGAIFMIALFYWFMNAQDMSAAAVSKTKNILTVSGLAILTVGTYKFLTV